MSAPLRPLPAYLAIGFAALFGAGSLVLLALFLLTGPLRWIDLGLDSAHVPAWSALLAVAFCVQHSVMVRRSFRRRLSRYVATDYHGALFAIASGVVLLAVLVLWQESEVVVLQLHGPARLLTRGLFAAAIAGFFWGVWALRGFDLLGVDPLRSELRARPERHPLFRVRGPYRWVRHPMYTLTLVLLWSYPDVTVDRLLLNLIWTAWIVIGSMLEERDLVEEFGDDYRRYRTRVPMLIPWRRPL
jgi:protein-S-isoprenylcysteine O-methyltransferase Ste14